MKIAVVGMGYVGCVTATCLARDGHDVTGVDVDQTKIDSINAGVSPVFEPGLDELLRQQVLDNRLRGTSDIENAVSETDVALVAVGTPSGNDGSVNYTTVQKVIETIGQCLRESEREYTIVVRSTLLPGVLEEKLIPALEQALGSRVGNLVKICNNPEFLRETTAINDYDDPPFVLIGSNDEVSSQIALALYEKLRCEKVVISTREAAMVKYASNAYHALKIAFANEIGTIAKTLSADGQKVMEVACRDTQLNVSKAYLRPGFSFGGSCLPKDVRALARFADQKGIECQLMKSILGSNNDHLNRAIKMIREFDIKKIGLIGLSFKAGTDDLRESPQVALAENLIGQGCELRIFDPDVRVTELVGSNLHFIDEHLPHLARLLQDDISAVIDHSELLIIATGVADRVAADVMQFSGPVVDLRRDLVVGEETEIRLKNKPNLNNENSTELLSHS